MQVNTTSPAVQQADPANRLRAQATDLEGVFLQTLVKEMFTAFKSDGPFGGGFAEDTWRGMQAEQFADAIAKNGGIGLADQIMGNLLNVQEAHQNQMTTLPTGAYRP
jgi:peptidoglycan hydrolase FlgJ